MLVAFCCFSNGFKKSMLVLEFHFKSMPNSQTVALEKNRAQIGSIETLMIEDATGDNKDNFSVGRTEGNKLVVMPHFDCKPGDMIQVKIVGATPNVLKGEVI